MIIWYNRQNYTVFNTSRFNNVELLKLIMTRTPCSHLTNTYLGIFNKKPLTGYNQGFRTIKIRQGALDLRLTKNFTYNLKITPSKEESSKRIVIEIKLQYLIYMYIIIHTLFMLSTSFFINKKPLTVKQLGVMNTYDNIYSMLRTM